MLAYAVHLLIFLYFPLVAVKHCQCLQSAPSDTKRLTLSHAQLSGTAHIKDQHHIMTISTPAIASLLAPTNLPSLPLSACNLNCNRGQATRMPTLPFCHAAPFVPLASRLSLLLSPVCVCVAFQFLCFPVLLFF